MTAHQIEKKRRYCLRQRMIALSIEAMRFLDHPLGLSVITKPDGEIREIEDYEMHYLQ